MSICSAGPILESLMATTTSPKWMCCLGTGVFAIWGVSHLPKFSPDGPLFPRFWSLAWWPDCQEADPRSFCSFGMLGWAFLETTMLERVLERTSCVAIDAEFAVAKDETQAVCKDFETLWPVPWCMSLVIDVWFTHFEFFWALNHYHFQKSRKD